MVMAWLPTILIRFIFLRNYLGIPPILNRTMNTKLVQIRFYIAICKISWIVFTTNLICCLEEHQFASWQVIFNTPAQNIFKSLINEIQRDTQSLGMLCDFCDKISIDFILDNASRMGWGITIPLLFKNT